MKMNILWIFLLALHLVACGSNNEEEILLLETVTSGIPEGGNGEGN